MARPKPNLTIEQLKARSARWVQKWRKNNPEKQKFARRRAYLNRKIKAIKLVGKVKCKRCGCDEIDYLEFNHTNGGGSKEYRERVKSGRYLGMMDLLLSKKRTPKGLEILCRVCNALEFLERKNRKSAKRYEIKWM